MKKTKIITRRRRKPVTAVRGYRNKPFSSGGKKPSPGLKRATLEQMVDSFLEGHHQLAPSVITINLRTLTRCWKSLPPTDSDLVQRLSRDSALRKIREFCFPAHPNNTAHSDPKGGCQT